MAEPATAPAPSVTMAIERPEPHVVVLFGATGDLARRKLIPALQHLDAAGLMPERYRVVGTSPSKLSDDDFREVARSSLEEFGHVSMDSWKSFSELLSYVPTEADPLAHAIAAAAEAIGGEPRRLYHLAVPPSATVGVLDLIGATGLARRARVILEKPFGTDLESARALNRKVHSVLREQQVFRIDHFLGKEAVQNILALRFANGMIEPIWNRTFVAQVQIDVPEALSIGTRGAFYEGTGAFRDMVVTHLFQVLGFVAMEPPVSLSPDSLGVEKLKVFEAMRPLDPAEVVRGQYDGYRQEQGVAADSDVETLVAARVLVDSWRWAGVPFYLRTGKCMAEDRQVVTIIFREPPREVFPVDARAVEFGPNHLTLELSDPPRTSLALLGKKPGPKFVLDEETLEFSFGETPEAGAVLEPYERLIHDAMLGDHTLFTTAEGVERLWEVSTPVLDHPPPAQPYAPGSWGPPAIDDLIAPGRWELPD